MSHRFLDFSKVDRLSLKKEKGMPSLSSLPHPKESPLPEEDLWAGPFHDLPGGDEGREPGHYIKDVPDLSKGTGVSSPSQFKSVVNTIPPRGVPR